MAFKPLNELTQNELLLRHFKTDPTISSIKAAAIYRIRDLPKRISELSAMGYVFIKTRKIDPTGQRYTEYRFGGFRKPSGEGFGGATPAFMGTRTNA